MDNLDSQTYDIFEKDPFKYLQYEKVCLEIYSDLDKFLFVCGFVCFIFCCYF